MPRRGSASERKALLLITFLLNLAVNFGGHAGQRAIKVPIDMGRSRMPDELIEQQID
ncbi:MAG: hypothetical protein ACRDTG_06960 [Pseudonocardiaceae bacterium]